MFGCLATAAALYVDSIAIAVGHRELVRTIHLWCGYLLVVPILVALLISPAMRRDAREVDGFTADDKRWLRSRDRRSGRIRVGKFNAGQKLNAALVSGAVLVMMLSGSAWRRPRMTPRSTRCYAGPSCSPSTASPPGCATPADPTAAPAASARIRASHSAWSRSAHSSLTVPSVMPRNASGSRRAYQR